MKINRIKLDRPTIVNMLGDVHLKSKNCAKKEFAQAVSRIAKTDEKALIMGDVVECIAPDDRRYNASNEDPEFETTDDAYAWVMDCTQDLTDNKQIIGWLWSNHPAKMMEKISLNTEKLICKQLKIPFLGYSAMNVIDLQGKRYHIYTAHGTGGGEMPGGRFNRLFRMPLKLEADGYFFGHTHDLAFRYQVRITNDTRGKPKAKYYLMGFTGSFYRTYAVDCDDYAERAQMAPLPIGHLQLILDPKLKLGMKCEMQLAEEL